MPGQGLASSPCALLEGKDSSPNWEGSPLSTLPRGSSILPPHGGYVCHQQTWCLVFRVFFFCFTVLGNGTQGLPFCPCRPQAFLSLSKFPGAPGCSSQREAGPKS